MKTLTLDVPVEGGRGMVTALRFREPRFGDLVAVNGEVDRSVIRPDRSVELVTDYRVVDAYATRLLEDPKDDPFILQALSVSDSSRLVELIRAFFSATAPASGSRSPTALSSPSGGTPGPSAG